MTAVRTLAAVGIVLLLSVAGATPAHAHAADTDRATNYRTVLVAVPADDDVHVRLVGAGTQIELEYTGDGEVVVLGYAGEPYLLVRPDGVFENLQSPATYLNRSLTADTVAPPEIDAANPPEWRRVSDEPVVRWHDHRAHWMGLVPPPAVQDDPDASHVVYDDATIPLRIGGVDGEPDEIVVDVVYEPGPAAWIWWGAIVAAFLVAVAAGWRWPATTLAVVAILTIVSGVAAVVVALTRGAVEPPLWWTLVVSGGAAAVAVGWVLTRRGPATPRAATLAYGVVGAGGLTIALVVGGIDRGWLTHSQLPVDLVPWLGRAIVAGALAFGGALAILAVLGVARRGTGNGTVSPVSTPPPPRAG